MSTKPKLKPRRMWANYYKCGVGTPHRTRVLALNNADAQAIIRAVPVAVIPLDKEFVADLATSLYEAFQKRPLHAVSLDLSEIAIGVLQSKGVLPKARKGRK